jgi:hypothetical protein
MLCPFGPSEYRHLGRSPCLRQGLTPLQGIICTNKIEVASPYVLGTDAANESLSPFFRGLIFICV